MVVQYKCPDCGADMSFDATAGMLTCDSCGHKESIDSIQSKGDSSYDEREAGEDVNEDLGDYAEFEEQQENRAYGDNEAIQYQCENCGAVLVTDPDTTATSCAFCGAPMILGDRLTGAKSPVKVIPFQITKEQATEAFKKWCKKGLLTPKGFMNADRIKNIKGMYVPFFVFDLNGRGEVNATCTKVRHYSRGDYDYTETRYYEVYRKVDLNYKNIPVDASEKMDDTMMDRLEPFPYNATKEFAPQYLAGYLAENYNYDDEQLYPRIQKRTSNYVEDYIRGTINGYTTTTFHNKWIDVRKRKADYTLLPVWMFCYDYKDAEHNFAMNGETGKIVGKPPLSKGKIAAWFGGISAACFILMKIIVLAMGGPLL